MPVTDKDIFRQMGAASSDGYFVFDITASSPVYFNPAFCGIFGVTAHDIKNSPDKVMGQIHREDIEHVIFCYGELLENGGAKKYVFRLALAEGEKFLKASLTLSEDRLYIYGIIEDFTIAQQNKIHIEQINARKNVTLEVLSHDLKEPMGMIRMTASAIENNIGRMGEEELRSSLAFISEMCERNLKLVRSMVNHEFLKSSVVAIKKERADLVWELRDVVRFYNRSHLSQLRTFSFSSAQEKIFLYLDSMKFLQVINNLISNSIKFTGDGGLITVYAEERETTVMVSVSDNGIGIPADIRSGIFARSKEVLRKGLNGQESGGLGMGIIKEIVALHRGKIWLVSEEGLGTTFFIELPKT
jgi:two-component system sensor histidine kinase VicK